MQPKPPIEIRKLRAPLQAADLLELLWHKGSPWIDDVRSRIRGQCPESRDHFFVAYAGRRPVAHVWYTVSASDVRLGHLGHVYTRPGYRRRGISARLMEAALAGFLGQGGAVMQLYTSNPVTVPFYEKLGFENLYTNRSLHEADWYMRYPAGSKGLMEDWFSPAACRIRQIAGGDLPRYCLLYNLEYSTRLKDWAQGVGLGLECEYTFITSTRKIADGQGVCCVLDSDRSFVGAASLIRHGFAHQSHLAAIDYYVHPAFQAKVGELIDTCLSYREELEVEVVYGMCADEDKRRTLDGLGFRHKATLPGHYRIKDQHFDCELYQT